MLGRCLRLWRRLLSVIRNRDGAGAAWREGLDVDRKRDSGLLLWRRGFGGFCGFWGFGSFRELNASPSVPDLAGITGRNNCVWIWIRVPVLFADVDPRGGSFDLGDHDLAGDGVDDVVAIRSNRAKDGCIAALFLDHPGAVLGAFGWRSSACRRET